MVEVARKIAAGIVKTKAKYCYNLLTFNPNPTTHVLFKNHPRSIQTSR